MSKTPATRVQVIGPNLFGAEHTFHVHVEGCADIARKPMYRRADGLTDGGVDLASKQAVVEYIYSDQIFSDNEGDPVWGKWDAYEPDFKWFPCLGEFPDTEAPAVEAPADTTYEDVVLADWCIDWTRRDVQTIRISRTGVDSIEQNRAVGKIRRLAKRQGLVAHINRTGGGGSLHVRLEATR